MTIIHGTDVRKRHSCAKIEWIKIATDEMLKLLYKGLLKCNFLCFYFRFPFSEETYMPYNGIFHKLKSLGCF